MKSIIDYPHPKANPLWSIIFTTPKTFYTIFGDSHHNLEIIFEIKSGVAKHHRLCRDFKELSSLDAHITLLSAAIIAKKCFSLIGTMKPT